MRPLAVLCALVAVSMAGCGGGQSAAEKLLIRRRGLCDASIGITVGALTSQWGYLPNVPVDCLPNFSLPNGNCDPAATLCRLVWDERIAIDSSLCGGSGGGCFYRCTAFAPPPAGTGSGSDASAFTAAVVCAQSFSQNQVQ